MKARARIVGATIAAGLLVVACGSGNVNPAALQPIPGTTLQQLIVDRNDPALMVILTEYTATVSVPTLGLNSGALQALADQIVAEANSGQIAGDVTSMNDAFVAAIAQNPGTYFTSVQPVQQQDVTLYTQCSGSIVTPDGYIVTAAHCTQAPSDVLQQGYAQQGLKPIVDAEVQQFQAGLTGSGFNSEQVQKLSETVTAYLSQQEQVSNQSSSYSGVMYWNSNGDSGQANPKPLSLVTQGDPPQSSNGPFGGKDVSILKLDGYSNLPTIPVGNDASIDTGQQLFIDGYPAAANADNVNPQNLATPTLSAGSVGAKMTSNVGVPLLETTATVTEGDSGGPGFDQSGVMVGTVSYGDSSYNYLIGASVVQELLHQKNIQPRPGETTTLFDTALNDYYRHYDKRALPEFQQVKALDPSHPTVDGFIQKSQTAIAQGEDQTPLLTTTQFTYLIVAVVAFLLLAGAGGVTFFIVRRGHRSHRLANAQAAPTMPAGQIVTSPEQPPSSPSEKPQPGTSMEQPEVRAVQQSPSSYPTATPSATIGFTAQQAPPDSPVAEPEPSAVGSVDQPKPAGPGPQASGAWTPFTSPPGWAWDGTRWIPAEGGSPAD